MTENRETRGRWWCLISVDLRQQDRIQNEEKARLVVSRRRPETRGTFGTKLPEKISRQIRPLKGLEERQDRPKGVEVPET